MITEEIIIVGKNVDWKRFYQDYSKHRLFPWLTLKMAQANPNTENYNNIDWNVELYYN